MNLQEKRELNTGFGDALARAVELVVTPGIFALLGWLLDRQLGTVPVFSFVFFFLVLGYVVWKMWMGYEADMKRHEKNLGVGKASDSHVVFVSSRLTNPSPSWAFQAAKISRAR